MRYILSILLIFNIISITAQDNITRKITPFSEIKVFDGIAAELIKSEENKIEISGYEPEQVTVVQKNGKLKIRMKVDKILDGHETFVKVYYTNRIAVVDANENARISSTSPLEQIDLEVRAQEAGIIDLDVGLRRLKVKSVTGGRITLRGTAANQDVSINTGGQYEADALITEQTEVSVSAGGQAYVNASEYVEAKVRAGGTIRIFGDPKVIDRQTFLGGRIIEQ